MWEELAWTSMQVINLILFHVILCMKASQRKEWDKMIQIHSKIMSSTFSFRNLFFKLPLVRRPDLWSNSKEYWLTTVLKEFKGLCGKIKSPIKFLYFELKDLSECFFLSAKTTSKSNWIIYNYQLGSLIKYSSWQTSMH